MATFLIRPSIMAFALVAISNLAPAQTLPSPSRTVYKCEHDGKVVYSDAPCPGA
jgi:hypothetical protein